MGIPSKPVHRILSFNAVSFEAADPYRNSLPMFHKKSSIIHLRRNAAQDVGLPCPPPAFNLLKLSFNLGLGASPPALPSRLVDALSTLDVDGAL